MCRTTELHANTTSYRADAVWTYELHVQTLCRLQHTCLDTPSKTHKVKPGVVHTLPALRAQRLSVRKDGLSEDPEVSSIHALGQRVRKLLLGADVDKLDGAPVDVVADEMVRDVNVLGAPMVNWVAGELDGALVVLVDGGRLRLWQPKIVQ